MGNYEVRKTIEEAIRIQGKDYRSDERRLTSLCSGIETSSSHKRGERVKGTLGTGGTSQNDLTIAIHAAEQPDKAEWLKQHSEEDLDYERLSVNTPASDHRIGQSP